MPRPHGAATQVRSTAAFLGSLGAFLDTPLGLDEGRRRLDDQYRRRGESFLQLLRESVYPDRQGPYARLLAHAGAEYGDVERLVQGDGVEAALSRLHDAGVRLTLDEFKGRLPIRRGSFELKTDAADFDNHSLAPSFEVQTGGSRSAGRTLLVDLDLLTHEAAYDICVAVEFSLLGRPRALWRPVPPGSAGVKAALRYAKVGIHLSRWFSQSPLWSLEQWRHTIFTSAMLLTSRLAGRALPRPEHVPVDQAETIARWLASVRGPERAGILNTNAASAVRVCQAAESQGLDISGSLFRLGGEPYTQGKAAVVTRAGCGAVIHYAMAEVGRIGNACGNPDALDDVHIALDKVAVFARDLVPPGSASPIPALVLTTLHPSTSKVMINVELGDYGTLSHRTCGCGLERLGHTLHLKDIRSYEKLTAEGMHFVGSEFIELVEQLLPATCGGRSMDYQLVEEERQGVPLVSIVVSPHVGAVDEDVVKALVVERLGAAGAAARMMADRWRDAGTLRVVRREPYTTAAGKVLALHVPQKQNLDAS